MIFRCMHLVCAHEVKHYQSVLESILISKHEGQISQQILQSTGVVTEMLHDENR